MVPFNKLITFDIFYTYKTETMFMCVIRFWLSNAKINSIKLKKTQINVNY